MFFVVDECAQTGEGAFLVFGLVARFRTFDEDFLHNTGVGVLPVVAQAHARLHFVHVLSAGTAASERIPLDFAFVDFHVEWFSLWQHGNRSRRCVYAALSLRRWHALYAVHARLVFQRAVDLLSTY